MLQYCFSKVLVFTLGTLNRIQCDYISMAIPFQTWDPSEVFWNFWDIPFESCAPEKIIQHLIDQADATVQQTADLFGQMFSGPFLGPVRDPDIYKFVCSS